MSASDVQSCVSAIVPCARLAWPVGKAPELPWAVFFSDRDESFVADGRRYASATRWCVELYEHYPDAGLESRLCEAVEQAFGPYTRSESWIDSEGCYMLALYFTSYEGIQL